MAINVRSQHAASAGQNTGTSVVRGDRAGESFAPDKEKEEDQEYQSTLSPAQRGMGGARWRTSPEGRAHRSAWKQKKMTPPPSGPKLTDIAKK